MFAQETHTCPVALGSNPAAFAIVIIRVRIIFLQKTNNFLVISNATNARNKKKSDVQKLHKHYTFYNRL